MTETTIEGVTAEVQKPAEAIPGKLRVDMIVQSVISNTAQKNAVGVVQTGSSGEQELISQDVPVSSEATKGEIREFSKSTEEGRKTRQETALRILQQRREHRRGKQEIKEKIEDALREKEEKINQSEASKHEQMGIEQEVLALKAKLRDRFSSWVHRVKEKLLPSGLPEEYLRERIEESEQRLSEEQTRNSRWETEFLPWHLGILDKELGVLEEQKEALRSNVKSKEELRLFYEKFGKQLQVKKEFEKDLAELEVYKKEQGTVQALVDRFDVYFVHAFSLHQGGRNNNFLSRVATWKEKLFVEVAERKAVSASTVSGDYPRDLWSPIGVFMGSGVVDDASYKDMVTIVGETGRKSMNAWYGWTNKSIQEYDKKLVDSITSKETQFGNKYIRVWNELVLDDNPKPVGFFVNLSQKFASFPTDSTSGEMSFSKRGLHFSRGYPFDDRGNRIKDLYFTEMFEAASFLGLPTFAIKDGVAYEASLDPEGELMLGRAVLPKEMIAMKPEIPAENLSQVRDVVKAFLVPNGKSMASATT